MDAVTRAYYEAVFERDFLKKNGMEFQNFFSEIMEKRYPGDFIRIRPWGRSGDRKNDGYLRSSRTLFQSYAPKDASAKQTTDKMEEDFTGALPYWKEYFDHWVFVHNDRDGLGPDVTKKLLELAKRQKEFQVTSWGFEELRKNVFELSDSDIATLLGPAPSRKDVMAVGFEDLRVVLVHIGTREPAAQEDVRQVPADKLSANALSPSVSELLRVGMTKADLVGNFFARWHDPTLGDRVAQAFKAEYRQLRAKLSTPDEIFWQLQSFAGGGQRGQPTHEGAVLAVLAFLFEQCEIFEEARKPA